MDRIDDKNEVELWPSYFLGVDYGDPDGDYSIVALRSTHTKETIAELHSRLGQTKIIGNYGKGKEEPVK